MSNTKIFQNETSVLKTTTDQELIKEYNEIYNSKENDCYGHKDLYMMILIENELEERGIEVVERTVLSFVKDGEEIS